MFYLFGVSIVGILDRFEGIIFSFKSFVVIGLHVFNTQD